MNESEKNPSSETAPTSEATPETPSEGRVSAAYEPVDNSSQSGNRKLLGIIAAVAVVAIILLGVVYLLEREGRISTGIFDAMIESQESSAVVAVVNGEEITGADLETSIEQFTQAATAQGMDPSTKQAQSEIRSQAIEVLVNTELLKQEAQERGIVVTDEETAERIATIQEELGGEEVLAERMGSLGLDQAQLERDIRDELLIQELLDNVFLEADITVEEEEIAAVYENAGGGADGSELPPMEEVQEQIEAQIVASKEQEVVDEFIAELRSDAEIEVKE